MALSRPKPDTLLTAVINNDLDSVMSVIENPAVNFDMTTKDGDNILHVAVLKYNLQSSNNIINFLLISNIPRALFLAENVNQMTPLNLADNVDSELSTRMQIRCADLGEQEDLQNQKESKQEVAPLSLQEQALQKQIDEEHQEQISNTYLKSLNTLTHVDKINSLLTYIHKHVSQQTNSSESSIQSKQSMELEVNQDNIAQFSNQLLATLMSVANLLKEDKLVEITIEQNQEIAKQIYQLPLLLIEKIELELTSFEVNFYLDINNKNLSIEYSLELMRFKLIMATLNEALDKASATIALAKYILTRKDNILIPNVDGFAKELAVIYATYLRDVFNCYVDKLNAKDRDVKNWIGRFKEFSAQLLSELTPQNLEVAALKNNRYVVPNMNIEIENRYDQSVATIGCLAPSNIAVITQKNKHDLARNVNVEQENDSNQPDVRYNRFPSFRLFGSANPSRPDKNSPFALPDHYSNSL